MSIENKITELNEAFEAAAKEIEKGMPDVWNEAMRVWQDRKLTVDFLNSTTSMLGGKSPIDTALTSDSGKKQVLLLLELIL